MNKITSKTTKTILFASLIGAALLSFSAISSVQAETTKSTDGSWYIKEVKEQNAVKEMDADKRDVFITKVKEQMKANPYNKQVYGLLEELSKVKAQIDDAEQNGEDTTDLIEDGWEIIYKLEEYGVVSEDRLKQNKEYWQEKAKQAIERIQNGQTDSVSTETPSHPSIKKIHTDDVSVKSQAEIEYKCQEWLFFDIYCYQLDIEWGGGSTAHASAVLIYDAAVYMEAGGCVHNNGGHNRVNFEYDTEHYVNNAFGNTVFDVEHNNQRASLKLGCSYFDEKYDGIAAIPGSIAHAKAHLDTEVTVSG